MQRFFASFVCLSLFAVIATAQGGKGGLKVAGTWTAFRGNADGEKIADDVFEKVQLVITVADDGKYKVSIMGKQVESGTWKADAKKEPIHLDLMILEGEDKGKTQLGLLKLEGDVMTVAFAKGDSKDRPKSFEPAKGIEVTVFKRGK